MGNERIDPAEIVKDGRRVVSSGLKDGRRVVTSGLRGGGIPFGSWVVLFLGLTMLVWVKYGFPEFNCGERDLVCVLLGVFIAWVAPLRTLAKLMEKIGILRENILGIVPHLPDLLPYSLDIFPYLITIIDHMDQMGPLLDAIMSEKEYILPLLPEILENLDVLLPHIDLLGRKIHVVAPYADRLIPHIDILIPHVEELGDHIDELVLFLDVRGWEHALPYIPEIIPYISYIGPHSKALVKHMDPLLPHIPVLVKHLDNLAPHMDETIKVLDRLVPLLRLLPIADQIGLLRSKLLCSALPTVARIFPRRKGDSTRRVGASPMPQSMSHKSITISVTEALDLHGTIFYNVVLNGAYCRKIRYRELRSLHKDMHHEISTYSKMRLTPFPEKTFMGRSLSEDGIERRRLELDVYFESVAENGVVMMEEAKSFRGFLRSFVMPVDEAVVSEFTL
mmetsp:Transcript_874/g.936  ORF Transcript_874/g.936 Transcript_874/m.936 type:complete len:449 (-) Transcript_874:325-1671(-)|eukprot:CAMPEP_0203755018 /NCGR_PEP_ID=MMETSP0098-20131031/8545_1 /ASSEMBLY_ACC=CAM_ASM_000208 /TAXON_ID=96639 /ORGANISM=" , Strain NY0313808BC1" /LENGTH=448 /DNA_ID=CAMNT_0050646315 /DNA_START=746 /DNA_END=2092 /DNA_ORIENTATION=+